jgi:hypothetical protein
MADGAMSLGRMPIGDFEVMARRRRIQRSRHSGAYSETDQNQCYCSYAEKTHSARFLSILAVPCIKLCNNTLLLFIGQAVVRDQYCSSFLNHT